MLGALNAGNAKRAYLLTAYTVCPSADAYKRDADGNGSAVQRDGGGKHGDRHHAQPWAHPAFCVGAKQWSKLHAANRRDGCDHFGGDGAIQRGYVRLGVGGVA